MFSQSVRPRRVVLALVLLIAVSFATGLPNAARPLIGDAIAERELEFQESAVAGAEIAQYRLEILSPLAGTVSLTTLGTAYTQNFNSLATTGTANPESGLPTGWTFVETDDNANTIYSAGTGSVGTGDTYSFGPSGNTDRAFGGLRSGSLVTTIGAQFTNNTGSTVGSLDISYTGEQWRLGATGRTDKLDFQYSTNATSLSTGTWVNVDTLDFTALQSTGTAGSLDGNAAANQANLSATISNLNIANAGTFWVRWTDPDVTGADDGLSIDSFSLTPGGAGPPPPTTTQIHDIQGNGDASPLAGQTVTTTGIVTLLRTGSNAGAGAANGFFLQTPDGGADADPNTSQGIFVFTSSVPPLGVADQISVTGTVVEFNGLTEIGTVTNITVTSTGNPIPTAVMLNSTILSPTALPTQPQLEKYEGMRMSAASLRSVEPNNSFFEIDAVLSSVARPVREPGIPDSDPVPPDPTSGTTDCCIPIWDENPERINLDTNGRAGAPNTAYTSNVTFTNVMGPLDYSFNEYRLIPEPTLTATANMTAAAVPMPLATEFTVAGFNIENFNNNATQRQKAALTIRDVMRLPDIIGHAEIFDLADLQALAAEVNTISPGATYTASLIEADGATGDDDQDVAFLVDTSRVQVNSVTQIEMAGCTGTAATCNTYTDPTTGNPALLNDRPPLVLNANVEPAGANQPVIVVVNHLRSFIDVELLTAEGTRVRAKRKAQAEFLADLLQDLQTANPTTPVISVGDYNAFQFNSGYDDSLSVIKGMPNTDDQIVVDQSPDLVNPNFINLIDKLAASDRYTFVFEGTPQALDHVVINTAADAINTRIAVGHSNADFPDSPAAAFESDAARPERASDHDPLVAYFSLPQPPAVPTPTAGQVLITEFRFRGAAGAADEYVELYNATNNSLDISGHTLHALTGSGAQSLRFTVPGTVGSGTTVIPARAHFLITGSTYSLAAVAASNDSLSGGTVDGSAIGFFGGSTPSAGNRIDSAGFDTRDALFFEGTAIPPGGGITTNGEYSFTRRHSAATGLPQDTGDNNADFVFASTTGGTFSTRVSILGAPGPENLASPLFGVNPSLGNTLLDTGSAATDSPNFVRTMPGSCPPSSSPTVTCDATKSNRGTAEFRRTFTNNTGAPISSLRFRVIDLTNLNNNTGDEADLRVLNNVGSFASGATTVQNLALEPPSDAVTLGGGLVSTLSAPTITAGTPLADGASISTNFLFGIQLEGCYDFAVIAETLPAGTSTVYSMSGCIARPVPTLSITDFTFSEGNAGTSTFTFVVNKSGAATGASTVQFATQDGTATVNGNDYQATSGTVTFAQSETAKQISVVVLGDTAFEPNETFSVILSNPTNAVIADDTGTGTIVNDDAGPTPTPTPTASPTPFPAPTATPTPTPVPTATPTPAPTPNGIEGDVERAADGVTPAPDGDTDAFDLFWWNNLTKCANPPPNGTPTAPRTGTMAPNNEFQKLDINQDGAITGTDRSLMENLSNTSGTDIPAAGPTQLASGTLCGSLPPPVDAIAARPPWVSFTSLIEPWTLMSIVVGD